MLSKFKNGFLLGFGAGFVTRDLLNKGPSIFRPAVKSFIKIGFKLSEKGRESLANLMETTEDLFAEVRGEASRINRVEQTPSTATETKPRRHSKGV